MTKSLHPLFMKAAGAALLAGTMLASGTDMARADSPAGEAYFHKVDAELDVMAPDLTYENYEEKFREYEGCFIYLCFYSSSGIKTSGSEMLRLAKGHQQSESPCTAMFRVDVDELQQGKYKNHALRIVANKHVKSFPTLIMVNDDGTMEIRDFEWNSKLKGWEAVTLKNLAAPEPPPRIMPRPRP